MDQPVKFRQTPGASISVTRTVVNPGNFEKIINKAHDSRGKERIDFKDNIIDLSGLIIDGASTFKKKERYGDNTNNNNKNRGTYQAIPNYENDDINYDNITAIIKSRNKNNLPRIDNDEKEVIQMKSTVLDKTSFRDVKAVVTGNSNTYSTGNATQSIELDHINKNQFSVAGMLNSSYSSSYSSSSTSSSKICSDDRNTTSRTGDNLDRRIFGGEKIGKRKAVIDQSNVGIIESSAAQMKSSSSSSSSNSNTNSNSKTTDKNLGDEQKVCVWSDVDMLLSFLVFLNPSCKQY